MATIKTIKMFDENGTLTPEALLGSNEKFKILNQKDIKYV